MLVSPKYSIHSKGKQKIKNKILVIEDNIFNLKLFRDVLHLNGYEVIEHRKVEGAIDIIHEQMPTLILLDIGLPDGSGKDMIKDIKKDESIAKIPIIAVTAFALKDDQESFIADGFDAFLTKPVSLKGFLEKIKEFIPN